MFATNCIFEEIQDGEKKVQKLFRNCLIEGTSWNSIVPISRKLLINWIAWTLCLLSNQSFLTLIIIILTRYEWLGKIFFMEKSHYKREWVPAKILFTLLEDQACTNFSDFLIPLSIQYVIQIQMQDWDFLVMMYLHIDIFIERIMTKARHITQHKRFVPYSTHPCLPLAQAGKFLLRKNFFYARDVEQQSLTANTERGRKFTLIPKEKGQSKIDILNGLLTKTFV